MKELKKIDPMSYAIFSGAAGVFFGFVAALFGLLFSSALAGLDGAGFGILGLIMLPLTYGIGGFIGGYIGGFFYNFIASKVGGIKIELKDVK